MKIQLISKVRDVVHLNYTSLTILKPSHSIYIISAMLKILYNVKTSIKNVFHSLIVLTKVSKRYRGIVSSFV